MATEEDNESRDETRRSDPETDEPRRGVCLRPSRRRSAVVRDATVERNADRREHEPRRRRPTRRRRARAARYAPLRLRGVLRGGDRRRVPRRRRSSTTRWYTTRAVEAAGSVIGEPQRRGRRCLIGGVIGVVAAVYYWRNERVRTLAEEVADELRRSPGRTAKRSRTRRPSSSSRRTFATVFFALMDRFWGFVTEHVYGS